MSQRAKKRKRNERKSSNKSKSPPTSKAQADDEILLLCGGGAQSKLSHAVTILQESVHLKAKFQTYVWDGKPNLAHKSTEDKFTKQWLEHVEKAAAEARSSLFVLGHSFSSRAAAHALLRPEIQSRIAHLAKHGCLKGFIFW